MNAAEQLRKEMEGNAPFTKEEFINAVTESIKSNGRYSFYISWQTETGNVKSGNIPTKYSDLVMKWAREEGFSVQRFTNYYGVPEYDITL